MTYKVSTHSRPKAAATNTSSHFPIKGFQHTAARRRLQPQNLERLGGHHVSTHSRPKAAVRQAAEIPPDISFNTQPPEGG